MKDGSQKDCFVLHHTTPFHVTCKKIEDRPASMSECGVKNNTKHMDRSSNNHLAWCIKTTCLNLFAYQKELNVYSHLSFLHLCQMTWSQVFYVMFLGDENDVIIHVINWDCNLIMIGECSSCYLYLWLL